MNIYIYITILCPVLSHSVMSNSLQPHVLYIAHQAPLSMGFSIQGYWSGFPSPGIELASLALAGRFSTTEPPGRASSGLGRIPWRKKWQPTPVLLPGKSHGQRSLADYSPWIHKRVRHDLVTKTRRRKMTNILSSSARGTQTMQKTLNTQISF